MAVMDDNVSYLLHSISLKIVTILSNYASHTVTEWYSFSTLLALTYFPLQSWPY